ncbi:helix-turn-helix domain-containing protein, partial [Thermanaerothrix sp.]|uniref:helix-turn-helix domain-containing protein n=1 Tax=Thermanaerothrix sp. TaxID=2972675 RepID=UPI003C7D13E3
MEELLTTRQVQDLLKVDRITIYRMLQDGRLKGVKIGQQWRFPRSEVERLLGRPTPEPASQAMDLAASFPTHCVQTIQDLYAEVSGLSAVVLDPEGNPLTEISHPCGFCRLLWQNEQAHADCQASWKQ